MKKIFADILGYEVQEWIMDLEALGIHSYDLDDLAQTQKNSTADKKGSFSLYLHAIGIENLWRFL